jgi:ribosome biogenesis GTPase
MSDELPLSSEARPLEMYGWSAFFRDAFRAHEEPGIEPARVIAPHRGTSIVASARGELRASITGRLRLAIEEGDESAPAVGDWVATLARPDEGSATIHAVLPRRTKLSRKSAGRGAAEQVVAANVDIAFLVSALTRDMNPRRIERYLTVVLEGGADPVLLLTKADLCDDPSAMRDLAATVAGRAPIHVVSSVTGDGIGAVEAYLTGHKTAVLLGSSGVGKSTLINRLLGREVLVTQGIREGGKGRHTTTHRELLVTPSGGLLIDTPGMRELGLWEGDEGVKDVFGEIEAIAAGCRFRDCEHDDEPGCAVRAALEAGQITADRLVSFLKLKREIAHMERQRDARSRSAEKARGKQMSRMVKDIQKRKGR